MKIYLELKKGKIYFKKLIMIERVMKAKLEKILNVPVEVIGEFINQNYYYIYKYKFYNNIL